MGEEGGSFSIYSALVWLKSFLAIETALQTIIFINLTSRGVFSRQIQVEVSVLALYNMEVISQLRGGGSGGPPQKNFWFKLCKIVLF